MGQVESDKIIPSTLRALLSRFEGTDRSPTGFVSIWCSWRTGHWGGGGRGGAIGSVPPKFMSMIRAHSSKLPVNRPFSMKRLFFSSCVVLIGQAPGGETQVFGPGRRREALAPKKRPGASWAILSRWSPGRPQLRRRGEVLLRKTAHSLLRNTDSALAGARTSPMTGLQSVIAFLPFTAESGMVNMP